MKKMKTIILAIASILMPWCASGQEMSFSKREDIIQKPVLSVKTNTLYWVALVPNVEAEVYLGKRLSINAESQFAWWSSNKKRFYYQFFSAGSEVRYWFREQNKLHGHYIGLYASAGLYDIMLKTNKNGFQGEFWSAGISYGYARPIGKNLSLEFGLGVGYLQSRYSRYERCTNCYERKSRETTRWVGPTKAKVALVWRIGRKGGGL